MSQIQQNHDLTNYNTFKIPAKAKYFLQVNSQEDVQALFEDSLLQDNNFYILGKGANTVFVNDYDGVIIKMNIKGKEILPNTDSIILVRAGAGEDWDEFVKFTIDNGLNGLENLAQIPGEVGASAVQNVGAYGSEAKDCIKSVSGYQISTGEYITLQNNDCNFGYRDSIFKHELKNDFIITSIDFLLNKNNENYKANIEYADIQNHITNNDLDPDNITAAQVYEIVSYIRENKLPNREKLGTAGSFFKNPVIDKSDFEKIQTKFPELKGFDVGNEKTKLSAGQLIDMCGLKGFKIGGIQVYEKHALILVNTGTGTGADLIALKEHIQNTVFEKFSVQIEPEVILI